MPKTSGSELLGEKRFGNFKDIARERAASLRNRHKTSRLPRLCVDDYEKTSFLGD